MDEKKNINGWGNFPKQKKSNFFNLKEKKPKQVTIRGNGKSYGDAATGNNILSTLNINKEITLDNKSNILTCSSGILLRDILNFILPLGFTIPTLPGTQFVTLGGMIAADVHGKNHFKKGSIGNWVKELLIQTEPDTNVWCSVSENHQLFNNTISGMGLTGIILKAKIQVTPIKSYFFNQKTTALDSLDDLIYYFENCTDNYQVSWIDLINRKTTFLHFSANESSIKINSAFKLNVPRLNIPKNYFSVLSPSLIKFYNNFYYKKVIKKRKQTIDFDQFFFPLDKYNNWNNLYGNKGMLQYQFIIPTKNAIKGLNEIIKLIKHSKFSPYLSVLKKYGENTSPGLLSFPIKGYSLAIDFPNKSGLIAFLNQLDKKVIEYNGRIYLAKDACLQPESLKKMYPELTKFKHYINLTNYSSNLAKRLKIK